MQIHRKTLVDELKEQLEVGFPVVVYNGDIEADVPYNNVKPKVAYVQFTGIGVILFEDGTWSIEDTTGG